MQSNIPHQTSKNPYEQIKSQLISLFMFKSSTSKGNDTSSIYSMIYSFIAISVVEKIMGGIPYVVSFATKFIDNNVKDNKLLANIASSTGQDAKTKTASITMEVFIHKSEHILDQAIFDYITHLSNIKSIFYSKRMFILNHKEPVLIDAEYEIYIALKRDFNATADESDANATQVIEIYSYIINVDELRKFLDKIAYEYSLKMQNKLGDKTFFFSEVPSQPFIDSNGTIDYSRMPNTITFTMKQFQTNRLFKNVIGEQSKLIKKRVEFFKNNKRWYDDKGVPYTLGLLLSGTPGSGKTSTIKCVANETKRHIINVGLHNCLTKTQMENLFFNETINVVANGKTESFIIPIDKRIYVFEDVDCDTNDIVLDRKLRDLENQDEYDDFEEEKHRETYEEFEKRQDLRFGIVRDISLGNIVDAVHEECKNKNNIFTGNIGATSKNGLKPSDFSKGIDDTIGMYITGVEDDKREKYADNFIKTGDLNKNPTGFEYKPKHRPLETQNALTDLEKQREWTETEPNVFSLGPPPLPDALKTQSVTNDKLKTVFNSGSIVGFSIPDELRTQNVEELGFNAVSNAGFTMPDELKTISVEDLKEEIKNNFVKKPEKNSHGYYDIPDKLRTQSVEDLKKEIKKPEKNSHGYYDIPNKLIPDLLKSHSVRDVKTIVDGLKDKTQTVKNVSDFVEFKPETENKPNVNNMQDFTHITTVKKGVVNFDPFNNSFTENTNVGSISPFDFNNNMSNVSSFSSSGPSDKLLRAKPEYDELKQRYTKNADATKTPDYEKESSTLFYEENDKKNKRIEMEQRQKKYTKPSTQKTQPHKKADNPTLENVSGEKLSLSHLLNILDGILETPGRIIILTSNYPEKLDRALIRPGRIDLICEFTRCTNDMIIEFFENFYDITLSEDEKKSIRRLEEYIFSPAEMNKILFENFDDYKSALNFLLRGNSIK